MTEESDGFTRPEFDQLTEPLRIASGQRTAAAILAGLPSLPASTPCPRVYSVLAKSHHRIPRDADCPDEVR